MSDLSDEYARQQEERIDRAVISARKISKHFAEQIQQARESGDTAGAVQHRILWEEARRVYHALRSMQPPKLVEPPFTGHAD